VNLYGFSEAEILLFFTSFCRVSAIFMLVPFFGDNHIPPTIRLALAFAVNMALFPVAANAVGSIMPASSATDMGMVILIFKELTVGVILGFTAKIFFDGLAFAFAHVGTQMGFNMATLYDHALETSMPVISQMIMALTVLIFLAFDGHHFFLVALAESFRAVPLGTLVIKHDLLTHVLETGSQLFWIAVKLSAPMALMIFLINVAFGIISKAVPQINVLIVSFTVNILAGFVVLLFMFPLLGNSLNQVFGTMMERVLDVMRLMT
jgi:flagellar biosynthesis protein FliR